MIGRLKSYNGTMVSLTELLIENPHERFRDFLESNSYRRRMVMQITEFILQKNDSQ